MDRFSSVKCVIAHTHTLQRQLQLIVVQSSWSQMNDTAWFRKGCLGEHVSSLAVTHVPIRRFSSSHFGRGQHEVCRTKVVHGIIHFMQMGASFAASSSTGRGSLDASTGKGKGISDLGTHTTNKGFAHGKRRSKLVQQGYQKHFALQYHQGHFQSMEGKESMTVYRERTWVG